MRIQTNLRIQTNRGTKDGSYSTVGRVTLMEETGFECRDIANMSLDDVCALYHHAIACYPAQNWRLIDEEGAEIDEYLA